MTKFNYRILNNGTAEITGYTGSEANLTIPNEIDGYTVTSIGEWTFVDCVKLETVTISDGITSIGDVAFDSCDNLTSVIIPNSVTSIGAYAFGWCSNLTNVEISHSVTSIGEGAFRGCHKLDIGEWAFSRNC